jgi:hypothetical protein
MYSSHIGRPPRGSLRNRRNDWHVLYFAGRIHTRCPVLAAGTRENFESRCYPPLYASHHVVCVSLSLPLPPPREHCNLPSTKAIREASVIPPENMLLKNTPVVALVEPVAKPMPKSSAINIGPTDGPTKNGINDIFGLPPCEVCVHAKRSSCIRGERERGVVLVHCDIPC